jgi:hypothetical protein
MQKAKQSGKRAGLICFASFMAAWLFLTWLDSISVGLQVFTGERGVIFFTGICAFAGISAFFGFSIAKKSKVLIIFSAILVAALPVTWIILLIHNILEAT